jgi:hypothetical protein
MPSFCTSCGAPLTGAFCGKCGQQAQTASTPVEPQQRQVPAQPAAVAPKSSGLGKVLLIAGGIVVVLFAMGVAGTFYGLHVIKKKVATYTGGAVGGSTDQITVANGTACLLLSREDLQQVLGVTIEKSTEIMEGSEPGCAYYTNPAAFAQLQRMAVEQARRDSQQAAQRPSPKSDNPLELLKDTKDMEGIIKGLGMTQPDKDGRVFAFTLQADFGRSNWTALRATMSVVPGFEEIPDVGDHAMIGSFGHAFYVLKGDTMIHLETMYVPDARPRGAELGRKIASHL